MMHWIHKEGRGLLVVLGATLILLLFATAARMPGGFWPVLLCALILFGLVLQFFRNPVRRIPAADDRIVYAPADGKVVVIEETLEDEYFNERRLQISIFMSPLNVHVNRNPVGGRIAFFRYHPGKYLVAWHPKSSTENERTTLVYDTGTAKILMRQIAGALARRIKWYVSEGDAVVQGQDMGFIKFGSRVDVFLPLDAAVEVGINQDVRGNQTVLARLS